MQRARSKSAGHQFLRFFSRFFLCRFQFMLFLRLLTTIVFFHADVVSLFYIVARFKPGGKTAKPKDSSNKGEPSRAEPNRAETSPAKPKERRAKKDPALLRAQLPHKRHPSALILESLLSPDDAVDVSKPSFPSSSFF